MKDRIARDFLAYLPARVLPPIFALLAIPVFTRMLPSHEYGSYLLATATLTLIGSLCAAWLGSIVVRFKPVMDAARLRAMCMPLLQVSVAAAGLAWVVVATVQGEPFRSMRYLMPGLLWILTYGPFEYLVAWLRSQNRATVYSIALCWRALGSLLLPLPVLLLGWGQGEVILWGGAGAMLLAGVILSCCRHAQIPSADTPQAESEAEQRRQLLRYGIPAAATNFALVGLSFADRYIIAGFLGPQAVAVYGASYDIAEKSVFFLNAMLLLSSTVMAVQIFEKDGYAEASRFLSELMRVYLLLVTPIVAIVSALAPQIVGLLLPASYGQGAGIMPVIIVSAVFVGIMHRYSLVLSLHKRTDLLMWTTFAALAVKIGTTFALVPVLGILGAAVSTLLGYGSWLGFVRIVAGRYSAPIFPWKSLVRILLSGGLAALMAITLPSDGLLVLALAAAAALCIYGFVLVATREISFDELASLKKLLTRRDSKIAAS